MRIVGRLTDCRILPSGCNLQAGLTTLMLLITLSSLAQSAAKKPEKGEAKKEPEVREELSLKNGDKLTGQLLNSTGTEIKFKTEMAGEVTVPWGNIKELKSKREFAVLPRDIENSRNSALVPQGQIKIGEKDIVVSPVSTKESQVSMTPAVTESKANASTTEVAVAKEIPTSKIGFVVDDTTYQKEIHRTIGWKYGWEGHIDTGSTTIFATQNSYLFLARVALKRNVPTVDWLDPKLRTTVDFSWSIGQTTQPGTPTTKTNVYHVGTERDEYFSRRGYYLQMMSFDHNFSQGLVLQQIYGAG
jgi:hypothetical protein